MDAYDRCTNLRKKIFPIVLPSMVEAENFSDHPRTIIQHLSGPVGAGLMELCCTSYKKQSGA